mgnify:CR=1 FL=1
MKHQLFKNKEMETVKEKPKKKPTLNQVFFLKKNKKNNRKKRY